MKTQIVITIQSVEPPDIFAEDVSTADQEEEYKKCPYCGQSKIPFKKGVCICGKQVGSIQYVNNPKSFAKRYYSYILRIEKYDTAVEETFRGLDEIG